MSTVRLRRLQSDHRSLSDFVKRHPRLHLIQAKGNPPESYQLEYHISSLQQKEGQLLTARKHIVEIVLPRNYPRTPPQCRMLTPVFHPNIAPHAICIGDHWAAGEPLWSMVARIGEMLAYQTYNTKSPLNGEAARWVDENIDRLPLDPVSMIVEDREIATPVEQPIPPVPRPATRPASRTPSPSPPAVPVSDGGEPITIQCPECQTRYRVSAKLAARRARCKCCQTVFEVQSGPSHP